MVDATAERTMKEGVRNMATEALDIFGAAQKAHVLLLLYLSQKDVCILGFNRRKVGREGSGYRVLQFTA